MANKRYVQLGKVRSVIRELFEYGNRLRAERGDDKVYDFSLGNPSVPPPEEFNAVLKDLIENSDPVALHGYTSAQGALPVRKAVADYINGNFGDHVTADDIYMTCGAAAALTISLCALCEEGDEVLAFSPYFPEYSVFAATAGAKFVPVPTDENFDIDAEALRAALTNKTRVLIVNSPNNPTGVVYGEEKLRAVCDILRQHSASTGSTVWLISDEPYRELVFGGERVPYVMNLYKNSIVCYSFSKSISLPGERIGYIALNREAEGREDVYAAVCGAGRALGYVCAPSMLQYAVAKLLGKTSDISVYARNRQRLCTALTSMGFKVIQPQGAFYIFMQCPGGDAEEFSEKAKQLGLLLVPGDGFGCRGYVRLAYCVSPGMIERSLPAFSALAEEYNIGK